MRLPALIVAAALLAVPLTAPAEPMLTVTVGKQNYRYDLAQIEGIQLGEMPTTTDWDDLPGEQVFTGYPVVALVEALGIAKSEITVTASDGYAVSVTPEDLKAYPALFATGRNGGGLGEKYAPIWLVFDYDAMPDADTREIYKGLSVWAVTRLSAE